jgi:hypothetical protein
VVSGNERLFYFPSYEVPSELFFERSQRDNRHPPPYVIEVIMKTFEAVYCQSGLTLEEVHRLLLDARRRNAARIVV